MTTRVLLIILPGLLPYLSVNASPPLKLWSPGKYRQKGRVEVTGEPGKDYYMQVGPWTYWYKNGQKAEEGEFRNGKHQGKWTTWHDNGQKMSEVEFSDGVEISRREWDEDGDPIENQ